MPEAPWVFFNWNRPGRCLWITYVQGGAHTGQRVWVWACAGTALSEPAQLQIYEPGVN